MAENKKRHNVKLIVTRVLAIILLIVGLALIFNKQIRNYLITQNQNSAMTTISKKKVEQNQKRRGCLTLKR